jgi:hypothetical protein
MCRVLGLKLVLLTLATKALAVGTWSTQYSEDELVRQGSRLLLQQDATSALCGASEYLCGGSDVVIDQAYTASQSSNCTLDTGTPIPSPLYSIENALLPPGQILKPIQGKSAFVTAIQTVEPLQHHRNPLILHPNQSLAN